MNCSDIRSEISAYLDGELEDAAATEIAAHLASCESCRERDAELRLAWTALESLPEPAVPISGGRSPEILARAILARG